MSTVALYGLSRSVYTRTARLALREKGVDHTLQEVEIFGPDGVPPAHLQRHPFGRIPAFEHDGFWLYETAAITRYVDEAFAGPALQPHDVQQRARLNQIVGLLDAYAYRPMVWGVVVERLGKPRQGLVPDEALIAESLRAAQRCLQALDALVACTPHLLGPQLTLADLHAYPMLQLLAMADEGRALLQRHAALMRWLDAMRARPAVQHTRSAIESGRPDAG